MSLLLLQLRGELLKLFARKRTYMGFGAFFGLELLVLFLLHWKGQDFLRRQIENAGYGADQYLSGLTLAFGILFFAIFLLGALYLSLVAGDLVSKEVEDGTMRMTLCRPVSRLRLLALKVVSAAIYTFALVGFVGGSALVTGLLYGGTGGLFVFAPAEKIFALLDFAPGLVRFAVALPLLACSLFTITALGFLFSCLNMKPAAATILTLSVFFADTILKTIPYLESIRDWFLTARMNAWIHIFETRIPWESMIEDYAWLFAIDATLLVLGWLAFEQRDFKS
jgi:ABC-2 type transport system permease protein